MMVRNKKTFNLGLVLSVIFIGVLLSVFSPIFGDGKNGLEYSDALFNKLAKGSSYFIPELKKEAVEPVQGKQFNVTVKLASAEQASDAVKILLPAGAQVGNQGAELKISGDLGKVLEVALADSDIMYHDKGKEISAKYGIKEKDVLSVWWNVLSKSAKEFQKQKQVSEADAVLSVMKKGIEPAYNFYGIEAQQVSEKPFTVLSLLVFYIAYTMLWGFAIFYLFDGLGLSMTKAKMKKEV